MTTPSPPSTAAAPAASSTSSPGAAATISTARCWSCGGPPAPRRSSSGFNSSNATSGNDITNDTLGQSALSLSGPLGSEHDALLSRRRIQPAGSRLARHFAARAGQLHRPLSRLAGLRSPRPSDQRQATMFFSAAIRCFHDTNPNGIVGGNSLPTVARIFHRRTYSNELGETAVLSPTLLNNARAAVPARFAHHASSTRSSTARNSRADLRRRHLHLRHLAIGAADEPPVRGRTILFGHTGASIRSASAAT